MSKLTSHLVFFFCLGCVPQKSTDSSTSTNVDLLFVIDNSSSMKEESQSLGYGITSFFEDLQKKNINANIGIVTTSVDYSAGATSDEIDLGEAGLLTNGFLNSEEDSVNEFKKGLYCGATFWIESELPSNPSYNCGENTEEVTVEYLDCLCETNWSGVSGSGNEEPIEAAYLAFCRSTENPPDGCFDAISPFNEADPLANLGFLREEAHTVIVMIGDEADNSRRMQQGQSDPEIYTDLFGEFEQKITFAAIGPNWDGDSLLCNSGGATTWSVERVQTLALSSGGFYEPLEVSSTGNGDDCLLVDFSSHLDVLLTTITSQ